MKKIIIALLVMGVTSLFAESKTIETDVWKLNKNWAVEDGQIINSGGSSFLLMKKTTTLTEMEFEVEMTPLKATGTTWKTAGVALYKAPDKFWQFAFIEAPDKDKRSRKHFVELKCKKGKIWGAESKLKRLANKTFNWEYGKTYVLKLKLSPTQIEGSIYAKGSDKALAKIVYELNEDAVKTGMPALRCKLLDTKFGKVKLEGK